MNKSKLENAKIGGNTVFPKLGIRVPSVRRSAILWYNLLKSGEYDFRMMHAGCPVLKGTKWISTKWIGTWDQIF